MMKLSNYEEQYLKILQNIMLEGYYDNNRTGIATRKLPHQVISVDLEKEFPILKTKFVAFKTAIKEMLWIYQKQSNIVQELRDMGVKVWNEWELEDGTIGTAYGYQIKKYNQIDNLIKALKNNPQDRRMMLNLWCIEDLDKMALQPCCWCTMWDVTDGRLNCALIQRSGDIGLGVPFNTTQFAVLVHLLAQVTGLKVGRLTHFINNAHVYENHFEGMKEQINRADDLMFANEEKVINGNSIKKLRDCKPTLKINTAINNFYDFKPEDIILEDYFHMGKISMEVAI